MLWAIKEQLRLSRSLLSEDLDRSIEFSRKATRLAASQELPESYELSGLLAEGWGLRSVALGRLGDVAGALRAIERLTLHIDCCVEDIAQGPALELRVEAYELVGDPRRARVAADFLIEFRKRNGCGHAERGTGTNRTHTCDLYLSLFLFSSITQT